ncbi:MAG: VCBS repeat-containing protein [Aliishimia sp.]
MNKAPRHLSHNLRRFSRGAVLGLGMLLAGQGAVAQNSIAVEADQFVARFEGPTHRYGHGIMGNLPEWGRLCLEGGGHNACVTLPETSVFEDIAPRLFDVDQDGTPEAIVVQSTVTQGAALVVYKLHDGGLKRIATPHIGTRNRWLAPAGIGDLDGDGHIELAYIDRPHLAKRLRIWRYKDGALIHVADSDRLTNHRIGEPFISGGLRDCGAGPEIITANANWSRLMASRLSGDEVVSEDLGVYSPQKLARAMTCQ